jgi:PAS domain S-box-containing protein
VNGADDGAFARHLLEFFTRLAGGDFTARIPRNFRRDHEDALAFMVEVVAEQLAKKQQSHFESEAALASLVEKFVTLAAGDFTVRAERTHRGDTLDTLAYLLNNVSAELGDLVADTDHQRMLLETVLESMLDGVLLLDSNGNVRRSNAAMAAMCAPKIGAHVSEVLAKDEHELASQLSHMRAHDVFRQRDTFFVGPEGDRLPMTVSASAHRDVHGELVGVVLVARDDRELKKARAHLEMTERLTTMGTLAAGVAHEINNPLAFISANLDYAVEELEKLANKDPSGPLVEIVRALSASRSGAERVRHIVRDLRSFARSDAEVITHVSLNDLCDSALGLATNEVRNRARVTKEYGSPPLVLGNEGRLVQVLVNLIQNGAQSIKTGAPAKNEIRIVTGVMGDANAQFAFLDVHDTGCGISEDDLPRIFDLFYTTKPVGVGMGLGLSISLRLVQTMGGRIDVESQLGKGSRFRIVLPAAPAETVPPRSPPRTSGRHRVT